MRTLSGQVCTLVLAGCLVSAAGCGDSAVGNNNQNDAEVTLPDAGIDGDALVDQGPLDCGVRPADGSVCVQGRLYDFETNQPVAGGIEQEVMTITNYHEPGGFRAAKENPDSYRGRIVPNGRFFTWTNDRFNDACLVTFEPTPGFRPDTVNCYPSIFIDHESVSEHRLYLVAEGTFGAWVDDYPGEADLSTDRPFWVAQCLDETWTPVQTGEMDFSVSGSLYWPRAEWRPLGPDRRSFLGEPTEYPIPMPLSGAVTAFLPLTNAEGDPLVEADATLGCVLGRTGGTFVLYGDSTTDVELSLVIMTGLPITETL